MSLLSVSHTTPTSEGITREEFLRYLLRTAKLGWYGVATGGDISTIESDKLRSTGYDPQDFERAWVRISLNADSAGSAPEGQIRNVEEFIPEDGSISVDPDFSVNVAASDRFELYFYHHPQDVLDTIDDILTEEVLLPRWAILSECPDYDMEQTHTTDWAASSATVTKQTAQPRMNGLRYLRIVTTGVNGYAKSATFNVMPGQQYHLSALMRCGAGATANLIAYDETNSAAIKTVETNSRANTRLWMQFTTPATCRQISIRLAGEESGVTVEADDVCIFAIGARSMSLPWWVENKDQVRAIFNMREQIFEGDELYEEMRGEKDPLSDIRDSANGQLKLHKRQGTYQRPMFIFGQAHDVAFTDDNTDTRYIDKQYLTALVASKLFESLFAETPAENDRYAWISSQVQRWMREKQVQQTYARERIENILQSLNPDVLYRTSPLGGIFGEDSEYYAEW